MILLTLLRSINSPYIKSPIIAFLSVYTDGWKGINPPKFAKSLDFYTKIGYL